jgi:deoxyguanosine kinase
MSNGWGAKLISFIGPPAAGKTTAAQWLSRELAAELLLEDYAGNPFLSDSYRGSEAARLPGQLYFLMSRVTQLSTAAWPAAGLRISDYAYCQDRIFARLRLSADEQALYEQLAARLDGLVHPPDAVVHLDAAEATLLERIALRGRPFERAITPKFLATMRHAYETAAAAAACPVIRVDCDAVDLRQPASQAWLLKELSAAGVTAAPQAAPAAAAPPRQATAPK